MENNTYAIAFSEMHEIFKIMDKNDLNKIPNNFKDFIVKNKSSEYKPIINPNIPLCNQKLKKETFAICSLIYRTYLISPEEKQKLQEKDKEKLIQLEKELREKYNPDNIFKKDFEELQEQTLEQSKEMVNLVEYKEKNIFLKVIEKICNFLKRNK